MTEASEARGGGIWKMDDCRNENAGAETVVRLIACDVHELVWSEAVPE